MLILELFSVPTACSDCRIVQNLEWFIALIVLDNVTCLGCEILEVWYVSFIKSFSTFKIQFKVVVVKFDLVCLLDSLFELANTVTSTVA